MDDYFVADVQPPLSSPSIAAPASQPPPRSHAASGVDSARQADVQYMQHEVSRLLRTIQRLSADNNDLMAVRGGAAWFIAVRIDALLLPQRCQEIDRVRRENELLRADMAAFRREFGDQVRATRGGARCVLWFFSCLTPSRSSKR